MPAPDPDAPVSEHKRFADEFIASGKNKVKPKNHPKEGEEFDIPPEDKDYKPKDFDPRDIPVEEL